MENYTVVCFYKFASLPDYTEIRDPLKQVCVDNEVKGTILLATEGINGTIAGSEQGVAAVLAFIKSDIRFADLEYKTSYATTAPFEHTKVHLKKELVRLDVDWVDPNKMVGTYVEPKDWNALISDPEVVVVDTRNVYECGVGTFRGAIDPQTRSFRQFPAFVKAKLNPAQHKKVAMFCTGGIRCEKASSYMLGEGFEQVYHLKGGILKYLEEVDPKESLWDGTCFVFDERVTVEHGLKEGEKYQCNVCRHPITKFEMDSALYKKGAFCPFCYKKNNRGYEMEDYKEGSCTL